MLADASNQSSVFLKADCRNKHLGTLTELSGLPPWRVFFPLQQVVSCELFLAFPVWRAQPRMRHIRWPLPVHVQFIDETQMCVSSV